MKQLSDITGKTVKIVETDKTSVCIVFTDNSALEIVNSPAGVHFGLQDVYCEEYAPKEDNSTEVKNG